MNQVAKDSISINCDTFHDDFQDRLDLLNLNGENFKIEEYYNNNLTVYISKNKLYTFRTMEHKNIRNDNVVTGTINEFNNIEELYPFLLRKRIIMDLSEVKEIYAQIKNRYNELIKKEN